MDKELQIMTRRSVIKTDIKSLFKFSNKLFLSASL